MFNYSNRQKESEEEKPSPQENKDRTEQQESWRNGVNSQGAQPVVDGETGESIPEQVSALKGFNRVCVLWLMLHIRKETSVFELHVIILE